MVPAAPIKLIHVANEVMTEFIRNYTVLFQYLKKLKTHKREKKKNNAIISISHRIDRVNTNS